MMFLTIMQIASDILNEDSSAKGILIAIVLASWGIIIKLYSDKNNAESELRTNLKESIERYVKVNQQYNDFMDTIEKYSKDVQR